MLVRGEGNTELLIDTWGSGPALRIRGKALLRHGEQSADVEAFSPLSAHLIFSFHFQHEGVCSYVQEPLDAVESLVVPLLPPQSKPRLGQQTWVSTDDSVSSFPSRTSSHGQANTCTERTCVCRGVAVGVLASSRHAKTKICHPFETATDEKPKHPMAMVGKPIAQIF